MKNKLSITKASGEQELFSEKKLNDSLKRAGASKIQIEAITHKIAPKLYEGISTKKIYRIAFQLLKESSRHLAAKYHLKRAIMELGPSGYPFEKFIAEIFKHQGYTVTIGQLVKGHCVQHEIDIIAQAAHQQFLIECKYHNQPDKVCDIKVPLYIQARFKDVESEWKKNQSSENYTYQGWVVTNTRFSTDAIQYGLCVGLKLIGWDYPVKENLKNQIDTLGLYPITCLTSLTKSEKQHLLDLKIIVCKELLENEQLLENIGIAPTRKSVILKETQQLCEQLKDTTLIV